MITNKQFSYLLFFSIISGIVAILLLFFYSFPNELINFKYINQSTYLNLVYLNANPKFDYLQGLWFMFIGIMMFCIMAIIELPDRFKEIKDELKTFIYLYVIHILVDRKTGLQKTIYHG